MMKKTLIVLALVATCATANAAPIVHHSDFINDGERTNFNGFESIPNDGTFFLGGSGPYLEDGISVRQVNGDAGNGIWVTYTGGQHEGNFSWYPNGGDRGYTELTRDSGIDFENVGMLIGSGNGIVSNVFYELLDNGSSVLTGHYIPSFSGYLGFSGGGFDTIRMADCGGCDLSTTTLTDGHHNALALDSIELSGATVPAPPVPEPSTLLLLGSGLVVCWPGDASTRRNLRPSHHHRRRLQQWSRRSCNRPNGGATRSSKFIRMPQQARTQQDAQKVCPARPQASRNRRRTLWGTLRISMSRERSWRTFSAFC